MVSTFLIVTITFKRYLFITFSVNNILFRYKRINKYGHGFIFYYILIVKLHRKHKKMSITILIFTYYILQHVVAEHGINKTLNIDPAEPVSLIGSMIYDPYFLT